jgi:hypothetical protein
MCTDGIFFNGVVPLEILIIVFFFNLTTISQIFIKIAVLGYKHFMLENRNISINMGTEALEEDTICYPNLLAGGKGINVWPIVKDSIPTPCSWPF